MRQYTFDLNGERYETDAETLALLREYHRTGNRYMLKMVFVVGHATERIRPVASQIRSSHG